MPLLWYCFPVLQRHNLPHLTLSSDIRTFSIKKPEAESKKYNKLKFGIIPKEVFDSVDSIIPNEKK